MTTDGEPVRDAPIEQTSTSVPATQPAAVARAWMLGLGLVLLVVAAYIPALRGGFVWDDDSLVTENRALRSLNGLGNIWLKLGTTRQYYPLTFTGFWTEYHLWNVQPFGYHLVNVLLHALNVILFWRVLRRLEVAGAWFAAAIFAVHPVLVESVAWVSELKNVLSCSFYLSAMLAWFRFRPLAGVNDHGSRDWRFYPLVIGLFLCALLSKTVTCSLPAAIVLLTWWKRGRVEKHQIFELIPLFIFGAALGLMTAHMEKHNVGAEGEEWTLSVVERCLIAGRALWFYAGKLVWPQTLTFIYPRWEINAGSWWQYLFPAAALAVPMSLWLLRRRIGKGPLVAALVFAGTLVPALGFFNVFPFRFSFVADHFQYLASAGFIALAAGAGARICERIGRPGTLVGAVAVPVTLIVLGGLTWKQGRVYRDVETLWRDTLSKNPRCWMAHHNLGLARHQLGYLSEAIEHYEQAVRIRPDYPEAHNNLGSALSQTGRIQDAIREYEEALRIRPDYPQAHNNLGSALNQTGKIREAIWHYEVALRIQSDYAHAHFNLANTLSRAGNLPEAIRHFDQGLQVEPESAEPHNNLGLALVHAGRLDDAIRHYEQALRIKPDYAEARYNLGVAFELAGRFHEAIGHYEQSLQIKPDLAEAQSNLAWLLATLAPAEGGDPVRAVNLALRACQLTGRRVAAFVDTLAAAYAAAGRFTEAVSTAEEAVELARAAGQTSLADQIGIRLELYRSGKACRESANMTNLRAP